jgi:hypothetical protein
VGKQTIGYEMLSQLQCLQLSRVREHWIKDTSSFVKEIVVAIFLSLVNKRIMFRLAVSHKPNASGG